MIAILDYEAGNQTSVRRTLNFLGIPAEISADPKVIKSAAGLIFPGVGAAGQAMRQLERSGLGSFLKDWVAEERPLLGICLGCQIMLEHSEENDIKTLGLLKGRTRIFDKSLKEEDGTPISIPHMGWNAVNLQKESRLFKGVPAGGEFYFVHSYYVEPAPEDVIATTYYGREFCSVLGRDGLWAAQFHVEKSGRAGQLLLQNFYAYCLEARNA